MEYLHDLKLFKLNETQDSIGNVVNTVTTTEVYCRPNVVGTREFYNAMAVGIRPEAELQIRAIEYSGEEECEYMGNRFSIIRTIPKGKTDIVLVIGTKQGVNG